MNDPATGVGQATTMRTHLCGRLDASHVGSQVRVCGWVAKRREHGEHLAFVDLRDRSGIVQCVVDGSVELRNEYVVSVSGVVRRRPEGMENPSLGTGEVEVGDCTVEVLSAAEPPPFHVEDRTDVDEAVRLRHRYVDLRRPRMQANLRLRAAVVSAIRRAMERQGFCEVETPLLWSPTPEGAREFAVPSRLHRGDFYVLPQSPQIAKQLLMVGGFDRYYQIARCLRDEDLRADRQFEFTQLDMEASFVTQDDVLGFVTEAFASTEVRALSAPAVKGLRVPGGAGTPRSGLDALTERARALGAKGLAWFRVVPGDGAAELDSPLARVLSDAERDALVTRTSAVPGDLVLAVADEHRTACSVLGQVRVELARKPVGEGPHRYVWVVEFPLFEAIGADGHPVPAHHPFTMPHPKDVELMETDPLSVRSQAYDLVLNGWELGSGSVRIHRADVQARVFKALGISEEDAQSRFGFLTGAFRYGAPPHAGFAFGIDRLVAILAGEESIREVVAFPKTQSGADPLTGAPKPLAASSLAELGIRIVGR